MSSQLIDELRSVEVVDWDDVDEAAAQPGVGFGYAYDQDDIDAALEEQQRQRAGAAKKKDGGAYDSDEEEQSSTRRGTVDSDAPAVFTAPQEVTNEEYDAVQQLLKQAKEAKNEAKQLAIERKKMEKQIKALTQLNEQLKAKNTGLQNEADENKAEQLKKLVEANARLAATKGKDPNSAKKQEELQRALEGAEGYLLDELEEEKKSAGHKHMAREPWYRRAAAWYKTTVQRLQDKMGHKEVRYVEARFGQGIAVYFLFLRYLWMLNVLSFIVGGTIAVYQVLLAFSDPNGLVLLPAGSGQVPRFVLFSLFPASGALLYASIMAGLGFFLVGMAVKKYSEEKAEEKAEQVYADAEANQFSKLAFGGWDFKMFDKSSIEDAMIQASENMNMALKEEEVLAKIANRSKNEKNKLLAMKAFGIFVNAVLILASWFTIGSLTYLSAPGTDSFFSDPTTLFGKIHAALPMTNLALIVINGILPAITNALIQFEKYDDLATQFQMETSRLYFGKILNALVLMYTEANSYVGGSQLELPGLSSFWTAAQSGQCAYGINSDTSYATKASDSTSEWPCPEDKLGYVLLKTILLDFFVGKAVAVAVGEAKNAYTRLRKQPASAAKSDFQTSTMVIQLLYTQAIAWLAVPYVPLILFWMPVMWYLNFKWEYWVLCRYMKKPLRTFEARKAQAFIANFFVISLGIALLNLYFFMSKSTCETDLGTCSSTPVQGGPFNNPTPLQKPVSAILPSAGVGTSIVNAVASPVVAYALVVVYVTKYVLEKKHRTVTMTFAKSKQVELQEQLQQLSRQMAKKDQKLAFFEKARANRDQ